MNATAASLRRGQGARALAFARQFCRRRMALAGALVFLVICLAALFAPWIAPQNPYDLTQFSIMDATLPPGSHSTLGDYSYLLGTDDQGRDMLSGILYGLRISILVGLVATLVAAVIGGSVGVLAGFKGGRTDALLMRLVDLQLSIPSILVALMILTLIGKGVGNVILAIVLVEWAIYARTMRSSASVESRKEYVEAARNLAIRNRRIAFGHVLPNCLPPITVVAALQCARAITLEATLSFLGIGVPITQPSLGLLVSNGYSFLLSGQYWMSFYPGLMLLLLIVSINIVGDRLREMLNPRMHK